MFVNFTGESAESLKSKFRKVATSYKGQGLSFLVGDAEGGKGALEVNYYIICLYQSFSYAISYTSLSIVCSLV